MNRLILLILVLLGCFIPACRPRPERYTDLESHKVDALGLQPVLIQVDHGEVTVIESEDHFVKVGGQVLVADEMEYQVSSTEKQILVKIRVRKSGLSDVPLRVEVRVPKDRLVRVETDSASVFVSNYRGNLEVASTSGKITIEGMAGELSLQSNRGNIIVRKSSGMIGIVGNYGALNLQNVHGEATVSTIMGNVMFDGLIQAGDSVHLETDHGSVSVNLTSSSSLSVLVHSTSGDVTCMLPNLSSSTRSCEGKMGTGQGALKIRTVSGAVTLQLTP